MVKNAASRSVLFDRVCTSLLFLLALASGFSMYRESLPFLYVGGSLTEKQRNLTSSAPSPAISEFSNRIYIDACIDTLSDPLGRLANPQSLASAAKNCLKFSQQQTGQSPANSYAFAMGSIGHLILLDQNAALLALERSRSIAPSEAWLCSLRLRQFRQMDASANHGDPYIAAQDIKTLGKTSIGRNWLAAWYKNEPASRELIVQGIEALSDGEKSAFLRNVKR